jgi:glycerol-3-phosphate O-acyltransferase
MSSTISLPIWLAVLLIALAIWAFVAHLVLPGARWFVRRRVNRVLEEIDTRLKIRLPPFKLTKREVLIARILDDPQVQQTEETQSAASGLSNSLLRRQVEDYAREIVPEFNAYLYFRIGYSLARWLARWLYRVRLGYSDEEGLAAIDPNATMVFLINHRSNMDYILVSYLAAEKAALSYAVGEWARIWPLQTLIRAMGAYFVRRNSKDPLYRKVLERYVAMATAAGVTQAVFPEGGLSREGKLRPPKLGILDYMVRSFDPSGRDIAFIPVGINYDRVFEDRSFLIELDLSAPRPRTSRAVVNALRFALDNLLLLARNKWHRFGYACVNFGSPVSLKTYARSRDVDFRLLTKEERFARVEELGKELMAAVASVIPVVPVPLVATVFVREPERTRSELELKAEVLELMRELSERGAHVYMPRKDQDYAITVGLRTLTLRHLVDEKDGLFAARPEELPLLTYYANSVAHLFAS